MHTMTALQVVVAENAAARNDLAILKRKPSDLVRYIHWTRETKAAYGSMTNFILKERLHWEPVSSSGKDGPVFATDSDVPFGSSKDMMIRYNDWPYGMAPGITHLVVWLKTRIPVEGDEGYLTAESRELIDTFVQRTFRDRVHSPANADDNVMWFKNWVGLQSVRGVEHVHVLLRNVPQSLIDEWTGGQPRP